MDDKRVLRRVELLNVAAKPILFNTEMTRAINNDTKTETRRVLRPQPKYENGLWKIGDAAWNDNISSFRPVYGHTLYNRLPYHKDDVLYVRETWSVDNHNWLYRADFSDTDLEKLKNIMRWSPSIHMPKKAARIFLRVTDVRVERLQNMTVDDCLKEGATALPPPICRDEISFPKGFEHLTKEKQDDWIEGAARARYIGWCDFADELFHSMTTIWNGTIKKSDLPQYGWDANPWVLVTTFERLEVM